MTVQISSQEYENLIRIKTRAEMLCEAIGDTSDSFVVNNDIKALKELIKD